MYGLKGGDETDRQLLYGCYGFVCLVLSVCILSLFMLLSGLSSSFYSPMEMPIIGGMHARSE